jgi:tetratricopeptide (TPR) repeat protein
MGGFIGRYCDGDPSKLPPDPMEEIGEIVATHAIADVDAKAILDQQVRLARLARRYQIALRERDPATLALLERVCLFRLGINSETMVSVFTGESKSMISGHALAQLDENEVNAKLMLLSEMRLLEKTTYGTYTAHPAIRDGFLQGLEDTNSLVSHEAVREGLEVLLGSRPGEEVPSEPRRLDLLEEIVYQTISTGKLDDAWSIYLDRLGGYANLGWRLGNYERGERICREFARRQRPNSANAPDNLSQKSHSVLFNEWGLYLCDLGRLTDAEFCYKKGAEVEKTSVGRSICLLNLAEVRLLRGAFRHSVEAARLAVEASSGCSLSVTCLAAQKHIQSMVGKNERGVHAVRASLYYGFGNPKAVPQKVRGFTITPHLSDQVLSLFERRLTEALAFEMSSLRDKAAADLLRSELALAKSDVCSAEQHLSRAKNRAVDIDCAEILCWCIVLETKLTFFALENMNLPLLDVESILKKAHTAVNDGLVKARDCGLSAFHIDLLLLRARLHLWNLDINASKRDTFCAIFGLVTTKNEALIFETETLDESSNPEIRGIFPPDGVERPVLLAATHPDCGYQRAVEYAQVLLKMIAETPIGSSCFDSRAHTLSRIENNSKLGSISVNSDSLNEPSRAEQKSTYSSKQKKDEPMTTPISPNVFISYTHDSLEHADRVLRLSNRLRSDGVESHIDQYSQNPAEGWPVWMLKAIEAADYVVVVSTKRYAEKASESKRSGGRFESVLILQELYELGMNNDRFIPVVFDNLDNDHILKWLKPVNYYDVESDEGYASLLRRLLDDPLVIAPPVGVPVKKGPKT